MSIKVRLIIMNVLQFFVWGSWLISLGGYMGRELHFEGGQIGAIFKWSPETVSVKNKPLKVLDFQGLQSDS